MLTNWLRSSCSYWLKQMMSKCARCVRVSFCSSVYNGYLPLVFVASPQSLRTEDCWLTRVHKDRELLAHYDTFGPGIVGLPQSVRTGHCWLTTVREDQTLLAHHSPWGPDIVGSPQSMRTGNCWLASVSLHDGQIILILYYNMYSGTNSSSVKFSISTVN